MPWPQGGSQPPPFPQAFVYPGSSANHMTSTPRNPSHLPVGSPLGSVAPPQHFPDTGIRSTRQPTTQSYTQLSQPPPVRHSTHPHHNASVHAPPLTYSHSSSPPHSSSRLPLSGPVSPPSFSIASGGHASQYAPGPPPLSPSMHRATTLPIPGQEHYAQPAYYQNNPAPGIAQRASYSGISMPEAETHGGRWSHHDDATVDSSSEEEQSGRGRHATSDGRGYERERSPTNTPFSGGRDSRRASRQRASRSRRSRTEVQAERYPCMHCGYLTRVDEYNRLGGFCSERHKWEGPRPQPY